MSRSSLFRTVTGLVIMALAVTCGCGRNRPDVARENLVVDLFATMSMAKRKVHDAGTLDIPKVLVLTTNIEGVAPELVLSIVSEFESLPTHWYCTEYGSGVGKRSWFVYDTLDCSNRNGPLIIQTHMGRETYCPYVINSINIGIQEVRSTQNGAIGQTIYLNRFKPSEGVDENPPSGQIVVQFDENNGRYSAVGRSFLSFTIPQHSNDTLHLSIEIKVRKKS